SRSRCAPDGIHAAWTRRSFATNVPRTRRQVSNTLSPRRGATISMRGWGRWTTWPRSCSEVARNADRGTSMRCPDARVMVWATSRTTPCRRRRTRGFRQRPLAASARGVVFLDRPVGDERQLKVDLFGDLLVAGLLLVVGL